METYNNKGIYDSESLIYNPQNNKEIGGSQISEPSILNPIYKDSAPQNQPILPTRVVNGVLVDVSETKKVSEPSATTDETKIYAGGGTTPDSNIIIDKPKTKYFTYGIVGLVALFVGYTIFSKNNKT